MSSESDPGDGSPFGELQRILTSTAEEFTRRHDDEGLEAKLGRLTRAAVSHVPGTTWAGLTMRTRRGALSSHGPSDPSIVELDELQARLGEGPCVDTVATGSTGLLLVEDVARESGRWPRFAPEATRAGVGSILSIAMTPQDAPPAALNLYAARPGAFDATSQTVAGAFAMQAAVALWGARRVAALERGLASRDLVGQAKGILMERHGLDAAQAFDLLVSASQDTNLKLVDVAQWLTRETRPTSEPR